MSEPADDCEGHEGAEGEPARMGIGAGLLQLADSGGEHNSARDHTGDEEDPPLPEGVGREEPGDRHALVRHDQPLGSFSRRVDPGEDLRCDDEPEHDLDQQRHVANDLDVDRGELVEQPVRRQAGHAEDHTEHGGGEDPGESHTEHVDDSCGQCLQPRLGKREDALADLDARRIGEEIPGEGAALLPQIRRSLRTKEEHEGDQSRQDADLGGPFEHRRIAPQRWLLLGGCDAGFCGHRQSGVRGCRSTPSLVVFQVSGRVGRTSGRRWRRGR